MVLLGVLMILSQNSFIAIFYHTDFLDVLSGLTRHPNRDNSNSNSDDQQYHYYNYYYHHLYYYYYYYS